MRCKDVTISIGDQGFIRNIEIDPNCLSSLVYMPIKAIFKGYILNIGTENYSIEPDLSKDSLWRFISVIIDYTKDDQFYANQLIKLSSALTFMTTFFRSEISLYYDWMTSILALDGGLIHDTSKIGQLLRSIANKYFELTNHPKLPTDLNVYEVILYLASQYYTIDGTVAGKMKSHSRPNLYDYVHEHFLNEEQNNSPVEIQEPNDVEIDLEFLIS